MEYKTFKIENKLTITYVVVFDDDYNNMFKVKKQGNTFKFIKTIYAKTDITKQIDSPKPSFEPCSQKQYENFITSLNKTYLKYKIKKFLNNVQ